MHPAEVTPCQYIDRSSEGCPVEKIEGFPSQPVSRHHKNILLQAAGGDFPEDFETLQIDAGLGEMLGHELYSPGTSSKFLYQFHNEQAIAAEQ